MGDSDSGEHSPADSKGADIHPGPALRKAHSLEHIDIEVRIGPDSREHSPTKYSDTEDLQGPAHSLKDRITHKESPASGGPDSRDHSTVKSSRDIDDSIAHSSTHRTAHKSNPASEGPDSRISQQHILVVCQILQIKLKGPFPKAITHQGIQVTTHHQPPPSLKVSTLY